MFGVIQVKFIEYGFSEFSGIGAGAYMENKIDLAVFFTKPFKEDLSIDALPVNFIDEILVLFGVREIVNHHNVGIALVVELVYQAAPNKSCSTGYYDHDFK